MAKGQKGIFVTLAEHDILCQAKMNFERVTGLRTSWGAFLISISVGALAASAITGLTLRCPNCESEMSMSLICPRIIEDEVAGTPN